MVSAAAGGIDRGSWSGACQFFITSLGSAVGLGNVWRFPNIVYKNGGAAFLVAYILALIFIAIPVVLMEATIGQYAKKGPIGVWDLSPMFRGIGFASLFSCFCFIIYYNTPLAWAAYYFVNSFTSELPWNQNGTSPTNFFYNSTLQLSTGVDDFGEFSWQLYLCNIGVWVLLFGGVCLGASSLGKIAYFTSLFPYVMLTVMVGYTATLPGADIGVKYYITEFHWEKLLEISVWRAAVAQVFFSTNCALGSVIQLSSYNKFNQNIYRDAIIIPICDGLTSIFAGFSVFTVLGYMAHIQGLDDISKVVEDGPGLIFITYPQAFSVIEGGYVWSVFFFFMVMVLGFSSQLPNIEMCCGVISDLVSAFSKTRLRNILFRLSFVIFCMAFTTFFYFGFGYYWYYLIDDRVSGLPLLIIGFAELIGVGWFYSQPFSCTNNLLLNIEEMVSKGWSENFWKIWNISKYYWVLCWTFVAPALIAFIFIYDLVTLKPITIPLPYGNSYTLPQWSEDLAWGIIAVSPFLMVAGLILVPCVQFRGMTAWFNASKPLAAWQPARETDGEAETKKFDAEYSKEIHPSAPHVAVLTPMSYANVGAEIEF